MLADDAEFALRVVDQAPIIAYDTETSGLDWKRHNPIGYVITVPEKSVYIPIRHAGGGNLGDPDCKPLVKADDKIILHRFEKALARGFEERDRMGYTTVGHNLKFDSHMSLNAGITLNRQQEDTSLYQPLLDEFQRSYSLDSCATAFGVTAKKGDQLYRAIAAMFGGVADKKQMAHLWRMPGNHPDVVDYASGDGITTLELRNEQWKAIVDQELERVARMENSLVKVLVHMERRGIRVDVDRLNEVEIEINVKLNAAIAALPKDFNAGSNPQTMALMKLHGHTNWPKTPKGNPSFPEKWLKTTEIGNKIVTKRKFETLINRYTKPIREEHLFEGRVHCSLHQLANDDFGTISGRLACSDPNLQAVHKRDEVLGRLFRSIYAADPGYDFYEGDYSQCEPRLFAHYSEDENLLRGYNSVPFVDVHSVVAELLQVDRAVTAKRMNMGIFTGMFPKTFAEHMDWNLEKATEKWEAWYRTFPGIRAFQDAAKDTMRSRGFVKTLLGRKCRLDQIFYAYKGTSRIIQGGNADILKHKMNLCYDFCEANGFDNIHLLLTVHDSLEWQARKGALGEKLSMEMIAIMADVQTEPFNLIVPFVVDWKKGPNWAIATYGEPK